jgi:pimeloyl-[acyl-carrier protein] synthase
MESLRIWKDEVLRSVHRGRYALARAFPEAFGRPSYERFTGTMSVADLRSTEQYAFLNLFSPIHHFRRDGVYLVTGFDEVEAVLQNHEDIHIRKPESWDAHDLLFLANPSDHEKMARLIRSCIDKEVLAKGSAYVTALALQSAIELPGTVDFDFHKRYTCPVTYLGSCHMLGIDASDAEEYHRLAGGNIMSDAFYAPFEAWCGDWLDRPGTVDDPRLFHAFKRHLQNGLIDRREALDILFILFHASLKTSASLLSALVEELLRQGPDFILGLQNDERRLIKFIEEVNRLKPANTRLYRVAARDCAIGDRKIPKGSMILVDLHAANRDSTYFEDPHKVSIYGNGHRNLTFGAGLHKCLGMVMARHMARLALGALMPHLMRMRYIYSRWRIDGEHGVFQSPEFLHVRRKA